MTQKEQILAHLEKRGHITALCAMREFSIFRLAARIDELRNDGHKIETITVKRHGKRYAEYRLKARHAA